MSTKEFQSLKINGVYYERKTLMKFCAEQLSKKGIKAWEKHLYTFIKEWISDSNHIIVQTSGSTGTSKTIKLSKELLIHSAKSTAEFLDLKQDMSALLCLSAEYIAGKMMVVRAITNGLNLICVEPDGNPLKSIDTKIDFAAMIPLQVANSLKTETEKEKLKNINKLIIGGGRIDPKLHHKLIDFPNKVYATYGMTETATHIALKKLNTKETNEHYQCLPGIQVSENHEKCLIIHASYISDRGIKTNDIAKVFSVNEFEILGRKDNIINTGGIKIIPEELEAIISNFTEKTILITSVTDEELGEKIVLLIENGRTNLNLLYALWAQLENNLGKHEIPKQIDFMSAFKYTKSGKIDRSLTKKLYLEKID